MPAYEFNEALLGDLREDPSLSIKISMLTANGGRKVSTSIACVNLDISNQV